MIDDFEWTYKAELDRVVDGDTYDLTVDLGFGTYKSIRVRARGIDTAEIYGVEKESDEYQLGMEQTRFVEDWFADADEIVVRTEKDGKGKYGRYIADVVNEDGQLLTDALIAEWPDVVSEQ